MSRPPSDLQSAQQHAEALVRAVAAFPGAPKLRAWSKAGVGARVYFPSGEYVSVGRGGDLQETLRGRATFSPNSLYPGQRKAYQAGVADYLKRLREVHAQASQSHAVELAGDLQAMVDEVRRAYPKLEAADVLELAEFKLAQRHGNPATCTSRLPNPAKTLADLPRDATVTLFGDWEEDGDGIDRLVLGVVIVDGSGAEIAEVRATGIPGIDYEIAWASAAHGWGPLAYDILMEHVTELGSEFGPGDANPQAMRVWEHYETSRPDVVRSKEGMTFRKKPKLLLQLATMPNVIYEGEWKRPSRKRRKRKPKSGRLPNPAKTLADLPRGASIELFQGSYPYDKQGPTYLSVRLDTFGDGLAFVQAERYPGDKAYSMVSAEATGGWGPFAYDILMERATELGYGLSPDRHTVSKDARRVWGHYGSLRPDVTREPEAFVHRQARAKFHDAAFVYRKKPTLLKQLAERPGVSYLGLWTPYKPKATKRKSNPVLPSGASHTPLFEAPTPGPRDRPSRAKLAELLAHQTGKHPQVEELYLGKRVRWIGQPGRMLRLTWDRVKPRDGNLFDLRKLAAFAAVIRELDGQATFRAPPARLVVVTVDDVQETQQQARYSPRDLEYNRMTRPYTTGDAELDAFLGDENPRAPEERKRLEARLRAAVLAQSGDLGKRVAHLDDANHRSFAAQLAHEPDLWVHVLEGEEAGLDTAQLR